MTEAKIVKNGVNPFLPSWEYVPDGEPHLFGGRLYLSQSEKTPTSISGSKNIFVSVGVQSPTEINAPRGCARIR